METFTLKWKEVKGKPGNLWNYVVRNFLEIKRDPKLGIYFIKDAKNFKILGCNISLKFYFLHSHIDYSPEKLGTVSEDQDEIFHQYMMEREKRYQGKWNISLIADYWWVFKSDILVQFTRRRVVKKSFKINRNHCYKNL